MIGGAEDDRLVSAGIVKIEDGRRSCQQEQRPVILAPVAKLGAYGFLRRLIQSLLDHVDDENCGIGGYDCGDEGAERR